MKQEITAQVVMLPTNSNNSHIGILKRNIDIINPLIYNSMGIFNTFAWSSQHLYFTTDEPIQEGDWYYVEHSKKIVQYFERPNHILFREGLFKIVTSTDPTLGLPTIPTAWIKDVYVPSNGSIKEVKLELEFNHALKSMATESRIKLTPNNEVVIVDRNIDKLPYPELVKEMSEYFKDVKIVEKSVDQTLEDAAEKASLRIYAYESEPRINRDAKIGFIDGAEWQKEQSANNDIEFTKWVIENYWSLANNNMWYDRTKVHPGQHYDTSITGKQLYELWQKTK